MIKYKGKYLNKKQWFSFCSAHYHHDLLCDICNSGTWVNVWKYRIGKYIYELFPKFWVWYMNK